MSSLPSQPSLLKGLSGQASDRPVSGLTRVLGRRIKKLEKEKVGEKKNVKESNLLHWGCRPNAGDSIKKERGGGPGGGGWGGSWVMPLRQPQKIGEGLLLSPVGGEKGTHWKPSGGIKKYCHLGYMVLVRLGESRIATGTGSPGESYGRRMLGEGRGLENRKQKSVHRGGGKKTTA